MSREQCDAVHLLLMVERCKALLRGGVFVMDLIEHFTDDEWKHLAGRIGPAGDTAESHGVVWEVVATDAKFHIYEVRTPVPNRAVPEFTSSLAIRCKKCGLVSHNRNDVEKLYCGFCRAFHYGWGLDLGGSAHLENARRLMRLALADPEPDYRYRPEDPKLHRERLIVSETIERLRTESEARVAERNAAGLKRLAAATLDGDPELKGADRFFAGVGFKPQPDAGEDVPVTYVEGADGRMFEKDSIEALLLRHPQTCTPSPLALAVLRFGSTQEPIR